MFVDKDIAARRLQKLIFDGRQFPIMSSLLLVIVRLAFVLNVPITIPTFVLLNLSVALQEYPYSVFG